MSRYVEFLPDQTVTEAARLVRIVSGHRQGDSITAAICRAARLLGWSKRRTKTAWYADGRLKAFEIDALRVAAHRRENEAISVLIELQAIVDRAERILARRKNAAGRSNR